jgi:hypothetical protein
VISAIPAARVPPNNSQAVWEFVHGSAPVTCARSMKRSPSADGPAAAGATTRPVDGHRDPAGHYSGRA